MGMNKNYFIKSGYQLNAVKSFSNNCEAYWTSKRIKESQFFQYHIYEYASQLFNERGFSSLLDIGSGPGTKLKLQFDLEKLDLVLIDQPGMRDIINKTIGAQEYYGLNIESDSIKLGRKFEMIICADVIEHLANPDSLLDLIKVHLQENGICIISTPDRDLRRGKSNLKSPNKEHVREWNNEELNQYLVSSGFKVLEQFNFPLRKLSPFIFKLSRNKFLYKKFRKKTWYPNQTLVFVKS